MKPAFPNIVPIPRPDFEFKGIPDPLGYQDLLRVMVLSISKLRSSATTSIGARIQLRFGIALHIRELDVIKGLAAYFNLLYPIASKSFEVSDVKYQNIAILSKAVTFTYYKYFLILLI